MDGPESSWDAEQEADDGEDLMFLVHQGLLPLPLRSILAARLVCKHWHQSIGCLISQLSLPFEAWSGSCNTPNSSIASPQQRQQQRSAVQPGPRHSSAAGCDSADEREVEEAPAADDAADAVWMPPAGIFPMRSSKRQRSTPAKLQQQQQQTDGSKQPAQRKHKKQKKEAEDAAAEAGSSAAAAAAAAAVPAEGPHKEQQASQLDAEQQQQQQQQHDSTRQEQPLLVQHVHQQQQHAMDTHQEQQLPSPMQQQLAQQEMNSSPAATAAAAASLSPAAAAAAAAAVAAPSPGRMPAGQPPSTSHASRHPLQQLPSSFPYVTKVTLQCRSRSSSASERALPAAHVLAASLQLLGQLPKLQAVLLQGSLPRPMWQPLLAGLQQQQQQQDQAAVQPAEQQQLQQRPQQLPGSVSSSSSLRQKLVCLQLVGCDLPPAVVLEGLLGCLGSLRELLLHASIKSPALQPDHLDALATGSQLQSLSLCVYQTGLGGSSRVQLNPLLALTNLRNLEMAYRGIFNDQRPQLAHKDSISSLIHLTSLSSQGLASPALPHPALTSLHSFNALGLTKRLSGSSLALILSCSSIRALRIEAGRRGLSAVAAEHLHHLGSMTQLSSISISLSKGSQPASKSTQQLLGLGIPGLKGFAVGSGDHRLGFSTEQLQGLAAQWPRLESLRLSSFSPLQGLAGLGAFSSLHSLSLKPGTGTGKLLFELAPALQPLTCLKRLHLDFKSALQLEHVQAVADACSGSLQHLSLNMRASSIGSKALEAIAQLGQLTSLQLLGTSVGTLAGPPAWQALQSMQGLRWLSVQAAEEAAVTQRPLELGEYLWNGVEALTGLQELRIWLGFGVEGRQAAARLVGRVERVLHDCRCHVLQEPEKPML